MHSSLLHFLGFLESSDKKVVKQNRRGNGGVIPHMPADVPQERGARCRLDPSDNREGNIDNPPPVVRDVLFLARAELHIVDVGSQHQHRLNVCKGGG